ncbi:MAG: hypothetical protein H6719_38570, partial [Sandaracinaceae bacterium]|nr:hypothetical protein [Sandaracinaceae bacterium]
MSEAGDEDEEERRRRAPRPLGGVPMAPPPVAPPPGGPSLDVGPVQGSGPSLDVGPVQGGPPAAPPSGHGWHPPVDPPKPPDVSSGGFLSKLGEAIAKKKADLLVAAIVGAVAGGTAGTIGGTGAGFGAGYASTDGDESLADAPPPVTDTTGTLRVLSQPSGASVTMDGTA